MNPIRLDFPIDLSGAYDLRWPVYGAYWIDRGLNAFNPDNITQGGPVRTGGVILCSGGVRHAYNPLKKGDWLERIAQLVDPYCPWTHRHGITEAKILKFVRRYGYLGARWEPIGNDAYGPEAVVGETVYDFRAEVLTLWQLLEMWAACAGAEEDASALSRWIRPTPDGRARITTVAPVMYAVEDRDLDKVEVYYLDQERLPGQLSNTLLAFVIQQINGRLYRGPVWPGLKLQQKGQGFAASLAYWCASPLLAAYLQLAHAIAGEERPRRCQICGGLMFGRSDKKAHATCSSRKRYREWYAEHGEELQRRRREERKQRGA